MMNKAKRGFTIVELLIVILVISILMAVLLPALAKARMVAQRGQCLSNLYHIAVASSIYQDEHTDYMPIGKPIRGISNYNHGGRYPVRLSKVGRSFTLRPIDRPLNQYVHPNLPLGAEASKSELEDFRQFNFPAFNCPADSSFNYQEEWSRQEIRFGLSAYQAVGTSYFFNLAWYDASDWIYTDVAEPLVWPDGIRYFRRARLVYGSRFAAFYDDPADFHITRGREPELTHHGSDNRHAMAFLDGHAEFVAYDPASPVNGSYAVLFPEQMR